MPGHVLDATRWYNGKHYVSWRPLDASMPNAGGMQNESSHALLFCWHLIELLFVAEDLHSVDMVALQITAAPLQPHFRWRCSRNQLNDMAMLQ